MMNNLLKKTLKRLAKTAMICTLSIMYLFNETAVVYAQGGISVSTDYLHMYIGDQKRFTITASNAVGSVDIRSTDEDIAVVDLDSVWLDNDSVRITVTAKKVGTCNIVVDVTDGATYDEEVIASSYSILVEVSGDLSPQEVVVPVASVDSGEIVDGTTVFLSCETPDAVIHYSFNGTDYMDYEEKLVIDQSLANEEGEVILDVYASKSGNYFDSEHITYSYTIKENKDDYGELLPEDTAAFEDVSQIPEGFWISGVKDYEYTGKAIKQDDIRVYYHTTLLTEKTDYVVSYSKNINVCDKGAFIIINGKGNYSGSFTEAFSITRIDLSSSVADDQTLKYNKKVQNVPSRIVLNGKVLKRNADYSLDMEKVTDVGRYTVSVNGKGNYKGSITFELVVTDKKPISEVPVFPIKNATYNGSEYKPEVSFKEITISGKKIKLEEGIDYTVEYDDDCVNAGIHSVVIKAVEGNEYVDGTKILTYKINGINLATYNNADLVAMDYTGNEIIQNDPRLYKKVKSGKTIIKEYLEPEGNYTITYSNNIKSGNASITYTGINGYTGTFRKTFKIKQAALTGSYSAVVSMDNSYEYIKGGVFPEPVVTYKGVTLIKDVDYKLAYKNNNKVNDNSNRKALTSVTVVGKGNFSGKIEKEFAITVKNINDVFMNALDCAPGKVKTNIVLTDSNGRNLSASDYYVSKLCYDENVKLNNGVQRYKGETVYKNDLVPANTVLKVYVKGKGTYSGSRNALFKTYEKSIASASATIAPQYYTGKEITLNKNDIVLKIGKTVLSKNDYDIVSYRNNINKGKAIVTIKGKGAYGGSKDIAFTITNKSMMLRINFDGNGATSGKMNSQDMNLAAALRPIGFKKTGYKFAGWSLTRNGSVEYLDKAIYPYQSSLAGKNITLYAVWE